MKDMKVTIKPQGKIKHLNKPKEEKKDVKR